MGKIKAKVFKGGEGENSPNKVNGSLESKGDDKFEKSDEEEGPKSSKPKQLIKKQESDSDDDNSSSKSDVVDLYKNNDKEDEEELPNGWNNRTKIKRQKMAGIDMEILDNFDLE